MTPYDKMVLQLGKLSQKPISAAHESTHHLSRSMGLSATSGYRNIASAEAYGFLKRDADGIYCIGDKALQIGLSAHGFGGIANVLPSILLHIRKSTRRTTFFAPFEGNQLLMGPFSMGRGAEFKPPSKRYQIKSTPLRQETEALFLTMKDTSSPNHYDSAIALEIKGQHDETGYLGLITHSSHDPQDSRLINALETAQTHLKDISSEITP